MNLKEFKIHIENLPEGRIFAYGISKPFSWRGSYDEVAFAITDNPMSREEILLNIDIAYTQKFYGYKGGEYRFSDHTTVNFEEDTSRYTDGGYTAEMLAKIQEEPIYYSMEEKLIKIAFR